MYGYGQRQQTQSSVLPRENKALNQKHSEILRSLIKRPDNKICADCKRNDARWSSTNLGVFVCIRCSGIHRGMGVHISRVKSIDLDTWSSDQVENVQRWGNRRANLYWEAHLRQGHEPPEHKMEAFIRSKYERKRWVKEGPIPEPESLDSEDGAQSTSTPASVSPSMGSRNTKPLPGVQKQAGEDDLLGSFAASASASTTPAPTNSSSRSTSSSLAKPSSSLSSKSAPAPAQTSTKNPLGGLLDVDFAPPPPSSSTTTSSTAGLSKSSSMSSNSSGGGSGSGQKKNVHADIMSLFSKPPPPSTVTTASPPSNHGGLPPLSSAASPPLPSHTSMPSFSSFSSPQSNQTNNNALPDLFSTPASAANNNNNNNNSFNDFEDFVSAPPPPKPQPQPQQQQQQQSKPFNNFNSSSSPISSFSPPVKEFSSLSFNSSNPPLSPPTSSSSAKPMNTSSFDFGSSITASNNASKPTTASASASSNPVGSSSPDRRGPSLAQANPWVSDSNNTTTAGTTSATANTSSNIVPSPSSPNNSKINDILGTTVEPSRTSMSLNDNKPSTTVPGILGSDIGIGGPDVWAKPSAPAAVSQPSAPTSTTTQANATSNDAFGDWSSTFPATTSAATVPHVDDVFSNVWSK